MPYCSITNKTDTYFEKSDNLNGYNHYYNDKLKIIFLIIINFEMTPCKFDVYADFYAIPVFQMTRIML